MSDLDRKLLKLCCSHVLKWQELPPCPQFELYNLKMRSESSYINVRHGLNEEPGRRDHLEFHLAHYGLPKELEGLRMERRRAFQCLKNLLVGDQTCAFPSKETHSV